MDFYTLLEYIHFSLNFIMVGIYLAYEIEERKSNIGEIIYTILVLIAFGWELLLIFWLIRLFQLDFIYNALFTKKFNNLSEEQLIAINRVSEKSKRSYFLTRFAVKKMNKRNNYIPQK